MNDMRLQKFLSAGMAASDKTGKEEAFTGIGGIGRR